MTGFNEMTYGPIADQYANKYGIPTDVFRNAINSRSGFDPFYTGSKGDGIAAIANNSSNSSIDPFNVAQQLDIAAKDLTGYKTGSNSWQDALAGYNGLTAIGDIPNDQPAVDPQFKATGGAPQDQTAKITESFLDTVKAFFTKYAYAGMFFAIGVIFIIATAWNVISKGTSGK